MEVGTELPQELRPEAGSAGLKSAVVVLNWNRPQQTIECLESLLVSADCAFEIVIVDNASTDNSVGLLIAWMLSMAPRDGANSSRSNGCELFSVEPGTNCRSISLLACGTNGGYAAGNSAGIREARRRGCTHVWILNNDTIVAAGALAALERRAAQSPDVAIIGSLICRFEDHREVECAGGGRFNLLTTRGRLAANGLDRSLMSTRELSQPSLDFISGASMYCSLDALAAIGDLSSQYFLFYEDLECCYRLRRLGYRLAVEFGAEIYHRGGATTGSRGDWGHRSLTTAFHGTRSVILFYRRNYPWLVPWALLARILFGLYIFSVNQIHGAAVLRGAWSGLADPIQQPTI